MTLVERQTGYARLMLVPNKEAAGVTKAIIQALNPCKEKVLTLTFDNGKAFAGHQTVAKRLKAECFFAEPYSSWQRGCNENLNRLIRQYFPKGTDFRKVTRDELVEVEKI